MVRGQTDVAYFAFVIKRRVRLNMSCSAYIIKRWSIIARGRALTEGKRDQ